MHAEWEYEAEGFDYESSKSEEARRQYRQAKSPRLTRKAANKKKAAPGPGMSRRRNKHWSW